MQSFYIKLVIFLNIIRCMPHLILYLTSNQKEKINADVSRWLKIKNQQYNSITGFIYLLSFFREYRNLFYNRIGRIHHLLNTFCPKLKTLDIKTKDIGEGLYISHGFSTGVSARSIGKNCYIGHMVSIGYYNGFPTIKDNVTIYAGAVIIGDITIGNNCVIGANASVFSDIPDNCTVYPSPSRVMKWIKKDNSKNHLTEIE